MVLDEAGKAEVFHILAVETNAVSRLNGEGSDVSERVFKN